MRRLACVLLLASACAAGEVSGADAGAAGGRQDEPGGVGGGGGGGGGEPEKTIAQLLEKALAYGDSLIGTPYGWWLGGAIPQGAPMFASNTAPPDPTEVASANCAGLTNLMMRAAGVRIPQHPDAMAGGTLAYELMYEEVAMPFDASVDYPTGTLIGRRFRDVNDQGHLAVVLDGDLVLQSFAWEMGGSEPGVNATYTVVESDGDGFYEYAVLPEDWLGGVPDGSM